MDEIGGGLDEAGGVVGFGFLEGEGGGGRRSGEAIPFCCSALWKGRKSNASGVRCIQPDGSGCNSPVQQAKHTPFLPFENGKNPSGSTEA